MAAFPFSNGQIPFNVDTSHPLIPNSQEYIYYKKYVSFHSQDRDMLKYPSASEFEIEMPQDLLNVAALRLTNWTFPANYNTFSGFNSNVSMTFKINNPYNPNINGVSDILVQKQFEYFFLNQNKLYEIFIEEGFYNPQQMVTELTNKFNQSITADLIKYFNTKSVDPGLTPAQQQEYLDAFTEFKLKGGYSNFIIVYNNVSLKLWFGNRADGFEIINEVGQFSSVFIDNFCIPGRQRLPEFSTYGLPSFLGLARCNQSSISSFDLKDIANAALVDGDIPVPRFYYGDVTPGDNGYWLLPLDSSGCQVHWLEAFYKLNIMGEPYLYMEIQGQNCIDETKPYNLSKFTLETNQTNGIVNSAFAKMAVPTTPLSQWFDRDSTPYKLYYPPAERIRRLKFKIRYHNGQPANFGVFNFSFMLEFTLQGPQILRSSTSVIIPPPSGR
jgi:hypothetical protein